MENDSPHHVSPRPPPCLSYSDYRLRWPCGPPRGRCPAI